MKGKDFIFTGLQPWDIPIGSNAIDIAREISKDNRVLYVNTPLDYIEAFRNVPKPESKHRLEVISRKQNTLRQITETLWVVDFPFSVWPVNALPDGLLFDFFNRLNNRKLLSYVTKVANELGFKDFIHFIDNDIYRSFFSKEYLDASLTVYYRRDNLLPMYYWKKHAPRLEPELIGKCDLVVCNSPQLAEYASSFNSKSYDVGQGVDLSAYDTTVSHSVPEVMKTIPEPRIGYIGDINSTRLDANLIYELAKSRPEYSFVMTGREDHHFATHEMHKLKNVYFTGSIPKSSVPEYMASLQVCLNPQLINEITIGNYPRKVDEYLAMGKPVVATRTGTMELFRDHTYLCSSLADYQKAVDAALRENSEEKKNQRILFAQTHTWKNNVSNIYNCLSKITK